ncbi:MAG: diguanylate cyclase [Nitrospinae bacterium]|nr:diguanylate cyclase [Nitrospinota bacterium]
MATLEGKIIYANPALYRIVGEKSMDDVFGNSFLQYYSEDTFERLKKEILPTILNRGHWIGELPVQSRDGKIIPTIDNFFVIRNDDGKVLCIAVVITDITEHKKMETSLRENLEMLNQLVGNIQEVFYVYSEDWSRVEYISPAYKDIWGRPCEDLFENPSSFIEFIHPDDRERVLKTLDITEKKGLPYEAEYRIVRPDGTVRWINDRSYMICDVTGKRCRIIGVAKDITGQINTQRRLFIQYDVTRIISESPVFSEAIPRILQTVCENLEWDLGAFWKVDEIKKEMRCTEIWHRPTLMAPEFIALSRMTVFSEGIGLPGRVYASGKPAWITNVVEDTNFPRLPIARKEGLHAGLGFPIATEKKITGILEFFSYDIKQPDEDLLNLMASVGRQIGQFIIRRQAEEDIKRRMTYEKTIADISAKFVDTSNFDTAITVALANMGRLTGVGRAYLFLFRENASIIDNIHEWCNEGVSSKIHHLQNIPTATFPWLMEKLRKDDVINIADISKLPPEAATERQEFEREEIKSILILTVYTGREPVGFVGFVNVVSYSMWHEEDITMLRIISEVIGTAIARKRSAELISHMAYHDNLTGLPNRNLLHDRLQVALNQARHHKRTLAILMFDLDHFKTVNDTLGHQIGDLLLKAVAERLKRCVREGDTICRMGGDEFIIVLPEIAHAHDASVVAEKIRDAIAQPFQIEGHGINITISIGVSIYPQDTDTIDDLIKMVDIAMYQSKQEGRNTYRFYKPIEENIGSRVIQ